MYLEKEEKNMSELFMALQSKKQEMQSIIKKTEASLKNAPEGQLRVATRRGREQYYHWLNKEKETYPQGRYINRTEKNLVRALAQKSYDQKVLNLAKRCLIQTEKYLKDYNPDEIKNIYSNLKSGRKALVRPIQLPDDQYIKQWEQIEYKKRVFAPGDNEIYTEKGERVLSKSEKILADKFYMMGIPYRYEFPLELPGMGVIHPDFLLMNKRNRKEFYWEHLGMMDNEEYCEKALIRIEGYTKNGFVPGQQLILTYETKKHPLNMRMAEKLIETYLL